MFDKDVVYVWGRGPGRKFQMHCNFHLNSNSDPTRNKSSIFVGSPCIANYAFREVHQLLYYNLYWNKTCPEFISRFTIWFPVTDLLYNQMFNSNNMKRFNDCCVFITWKWSRRKTADHSSHFGVRGSFGVFSFELINAMFTEMREKVAFCVTSNRVRGLDKGQLIK